MIDRQAFIAANTGLVHACANRFRNRGIDYDDLFQAGCIGLIKAADRFDESRGLQFSTYAVPVILGEIRCLFRQNSTVKIGRGLRELSQKAQRESEAFAARENRMPTVGELAAILQVEPEEAEKYDAKYIEMIRDNTLLINTDGALVGELNGLTVMSIGDYTFGKPAKITVNTYTGKNGVVNIEREVEISGPSHSKGVLILTGYLGEMFAQDIPLCLTASICFEQLYNGVDGDSASSTELYGLLSSLSGIPINQSIAVTGSVNQKGQIQPIGGVNEKIEGFFQICKMRGLDGSHGVMIPIQNVDNLQLSDEIVEAVKNKQFHIYSVSTIEEGIEVLTGVPAGRKDKNGKFPAGTVNYLVYEKLKKYAETVNGK